MENQQHQNLEQDPNNDEIDVKALLLKILGYWPAIVVCLIVALVIAFVVNRYATNTYELEAKIHLKESDNPLLGDNVSLAFNWGGASDLVKSHMAILESYTHNLRVARSLHWEVRYFGEGRVKEVEIYESPPFRVVLDTHHVQLVGTRFDVDLAEKSFALKLGEMENPSFYHFGRERNLNDSLRNPSLEIKDQY